MDREKRLEALTAQSPSNPFAWYSLAMEKKKRDPKDALAIFERVHREHPDYLPSYYHYAQTLAETEDQAGARRVYEAGIAVARAKGDTHAQGELQAALDLL